MVGRHQAADQADTVQDEEIMDGFLLTNANDVPAKGGNLSVYDQEQA